MSSLEKKRDEFRKYLEGAGAIDNLTKALIKLYEQQNKPEDAVKFLRKNMCESCPDDEQFEIVSADLEKANKKICELERELSKMKGSIRRSSSETELALTKGFQELSDVVDSPSLLKKFLTKDMIDQLKQKTSFKGTLLDCIQAGIEHLDYPKGIFACDAEAYSAFAPLFDQVIEEIHGFKKEDKQPACDWGEPCNLPELDPSGEFVQLIRIECSRSVDCFPFAAIMTFEHYEEIMSKLQKATKCMSGSLKGKFYPLEAMDLDLKKSLIDEKILFDENNDVLKAARATRFWPTGRGIYVNEAKTFAVWCNQEDHLRFVSLEKGGNLKDAYDRLVSGVKKLEKDIALARHDRLGFLTFSPENLGNTICVSAHLKLQKLPQKEETLCELEKNLRLKITKLEDGNVFEVIYLKRVGITEFETVKNFADAIVAIIESEKSYDANAQA